MVDLIKFTTQGILYPKRFIEGRLKKSNKTISSLKNGDGAILTVEGKKVAVYKSIEGKIDKLSPVCRQGASWTLIKKIRLGTARVMVPDTKQMELSLGDLLRKT